MGLDNLLNARFILAVVLTLLIVIPTAYFVFRFGFKLKNEDLVMMIFGSYYINVGYMGIPIASLLLNSVIPVMIILVMQASFLFPLTVFMMDLKTGGNKSINLKDTLLILVKNPILLSSLIAILSLVLKIEYPEIVLRTTDLLGRPASTVGLFALGFTCYLPAERRITALEMKQALTATFIKIIYHPLVAWLVGKYVFNLDRWWLIAIVVSAMLPTAVNHFIVSLRYRCNENASKLIILFTTFGFTIVMSIFLYLIGGI